MYYHSSGFSTSNVGPHYGSMAGAYCGAQGAVPAAPYQHHGCEGQDHQRGYSQGTYADLSASQGRERDTDQSPPGKTFDWMKVKRNPPKTGGLNCLFEANIIRCTLKPREMMPYIKQISFRICITNTLYTNWKLLT